jgi:cytochrome c553
MIWLKRIGIGVVAFLILAIAVVYGGSQWKIGQDRSVPLIAFRAASEPAAIAEGTRIAGVAGCKGCHGAAGKGRVFVDNLLVGRLAPPGLARKAALYSDAELERLIRHGVKRDGTGVFIMSTDQLSHLSDRDVAGVIGWMRTLKPAPDDQVGATRFGPLLRLGVLTGGLKVNVVAARVAAGERPTDRGRYFVEVACQQCHAMRESRPSEGSDQIVPPLLAVAPAYDLPAFTRLLHTGQGLSPRDLGAMKDAVKEGMSGLHDDEIAAIHAYFVAEAAKAPAH